MARVYIVHDDDAGTNGQVFYRHLREAKKHAQDAADVIGIDVEVVRSTVGRMPLADLVVALLNHEGWAIDHETVYTAKPNRKAA